MRPYRNDLSSSIIHKIREESRFIDKKDVKLISDGVNTEEQNILRELQLDKELLKMDDLMGRDKMRDLLQVKGFDAPIRGDELYQFAQDHNLKLFHTSCFEGKLSKNAGAALSEFVKAANIPSISHSAQRFYVMAPSFIFRKGWSIWKNIIKTSPIIIYKHSSGHIEDKEWYTIVYGWGKSYKPLNRILGYLNSRKFMRLRFWLMTRSIPILSLYLFFIGASNKNGYMAIAGLAIWAPFVMLIASRDSEKGERYSSNNVDAVYSDDIQQIEYKNRYWWFLRTGKTTKE